MIDNKKTEIIEILKSIENMTMEARLALAASNEFSLDDMASLMVRATGIAYAANGVTVVVMGMGENKE